MAAKNNDIVQVEIDKALALQRSVAAEMQRLKSVQQQVDDAWSAVQDAMEQHNVKSIKTDAGSITLAERTSYKTTAELPDEFYKRAPDVKKIGEHHTLLDELPPGVTAQTTRYLIKRIK
jgi:hypothetical protein